MVLKEDFMRNKKGNKWIIIAASVVIIAAALIVFINNNSASPNGIYNLNIFCARR